MVSRRVRREFSAGEWTEVGVKFRVIKFMKNKALAQVLPALAAIYFVVIGKWSTINVDTWIECSTRTG